MWYNFNLKIIWRKPQMKNKWKILLLFHYTEINNIGSDTFTIDTKYCKNFIYIFPSQYHL